MSDNSGDSPIEQDTLGDLAFTDYEDLLDSLRKDLQLDATIDVQPGTVFQALVNDTGSQGTINTPSKTTLDEQILKLPRGAASFATNVATNNTSGVPNTWSGTVANGCSITAATGITVPTAGAYVVTYGVRCDTAAGTQIESTVTKNGANVGTTILFIGTTSTSPGAPQIFGLAAGDVINLTFFTSAAGTWFGSGAWSNFLHVWFISS